MITGLFGPPPMSMRVERAFLVLTVAEVVLRRRGLDLRARPDEVAPQTGQSRSMTCVSLVQGSGGMTPSAKASAPTLSMICSVMFSVSVALFVVVEVSS